MPVRIIEDAIEAVTVATEEITRLHDQLVQERAVTSELLAALKTLEHEATSYVNLSRIRGEDLRAEAADSVRNALAHARTVLASAEGRRP